MIFIECKSKEARLAEILCCAGGRSLGLPVWLIQQLHSRVETPVSGGPGLMTRAIKVPQLTT